MSEKYIVQTNVIGTSLKTISSNLEQYKKHLLVSLWVLSKNNFNRVFTFQNWKYWNEIYFKGYSKSIWNSGIREY